MSRTRRHGRPVSAVALAGPRYVAPIRAWASLVVMGAIVRTRQAVRES